MKGFLDTIMLERPRWQKLAILIGTVVCLLALDYVFLYGPRSREIASLSEDIEAARNEKAIKQQRIINLERLQQEIKEIDARLNEAVAQLPSKREIPDLLSSVSNKARESGLQILRFRPRPEAYQEFYAEVPVDIVVKGSFHDVVAFFDEVGRLERLVNINNIEFKSSVAEDRVTVESSSLATAFRFLEESERKKVVEEMAKAAKGKQ